tara:strand:+ start:1371 stop:1763 length:393 start_codon:yes stop_codon:yes gene_type:complete
MKNAVKEMNLAAEKLTDKQRMFIDNLFIPGTTQEQAAINAGYAKRSAKVQASRNLKVSAVQEYLNTCVQEAIQSNSIRALNTVANLSDSANSSYVRLQAAQDILDRAGHKPVDKSAVAIKGDMTVHIDLS